MTTVEIEFTDGKTHTLNGVRQIEFKDGYTRWRFLDPVRPDRTCYIIPIEAIKSAKLMST